MPVAQDWEPWQRFANEDERSFALFQQYLAEPLPRDIRRLARLSRLSYSVLDSLAFQWEWQARARLWDDHLDAIRRRTIESYTEENARNVAERQLRLLTRMQRLAENETDKLLEIAEANNAPGVITPRDIVRMATMGIRLERLIRGEVTERHEVGPDLSSLSLDDLRAIRSAQAKIGIR